VAFNHPRTPAPDFLIIRFLCFFRTTFPPSKARHSSVPPLIRQQNYQSKQIAGGIAHIDFLHYPAKISDKS